MKRVEIERAEGRPKRADARPRLPKTDKRFMRAQIGRGGAPLRSKLFEREQKVSIPRRARFF